MKEGQSTEEGVSIAHKLMEQLGVKKEDLIEGAYMDLLLAKQKMQNGHKWKHYCLSDHELMRQIVM